MGNVFWVQVAISFLLWLAAGAVMMRGSQKLRAHAFATPRTARAGRSALLFLLSPTVIFAPLWFVWTHGGVLPDRLLAWAWLLITLGGLGCVTCATLGLAYAVSIAMEVAKDSRVTTEAAPASTIKDPSDR